MTVYRPKFVRQWGDPTTTLDWTNCNMASGAMALDFDTLGHFQEWGGELRAVSGDLSGGTGLGTPGLEKAWAHYGQVLHIGDGDWSDVKAWLKGYRGIVLQGMYGALPKAYHSPLNSLTFTGPHAVYVNPEWQADGDWLMGDPLNDKYIWVPEAALRSYAEALAVHERGTRAKLFFASSDPHVPAPAPTRVDYVHTVKVTASPYVNIREQPTAASADVGNLNEGVTFKTTHLEKAGGRYVVAGVVRTDWLGFIHGGEEDWVARAYTRVIV